jgi:hypothetical protein
MRLAGSTKEETTGTPGKLAQTCAFTVKWCMLTFSLSGHCRKHQAVCEVGSEA